MAKTEKKQEQRFLNTHFESSRAGPVPNLELVPPVSTYKEPDHSQEKWLQSGIIVKNS